jgi:hypothetical protein
VKPPTVRLAPAKALPPARPQPESGPIVKLAIRLNATVNDELRSMIRYRGDLSKLAIEALEQVDLRTAALISDEEPMVPDTTISLPRGLYKKIRAIAKERSASMNILVSTALAHWLAGQGKLKLE